MIVSPYSVASALAFLSQGTNGNSLEQIKSGLHVKSGKSEIADEYFQYHDLLGRDAGNVSFSIANQLFVQDGFALNKNFKEVATQKFFSGVEKVDFAKKVEAAATINHFVAKKTHDKIKEIVTPDQLSADSRVVLVNAIHMRAKWEKPFPPYNTYKQNFYANKVDKASVDFMHDLTEYNYGSFADLDASVLEMKYLDSDLSLVIFLPNSRTGLSALENKLKDYDVPKFLMHMSKQLVKVSIPKFKIDYEVKLNDILTRVSSFETFPHVQNPNFLSISFYFVTLFRWECQTYLMPIKPI